MKKYWLGVSLAVLVSSGARGQTVTIAPVATTNPCAGTWVTDTVMIEVQKTLYANGIKIRVTSLSPDAIFAPKAEVVLSPIKSGKLSGSFYLKDSSGALTILKCSQSEMQYTGGILNGHNFKLTVSKTLKKISDDTDGY